MLRNPLALGVALASLAVVEPARAQTTVSGFGEPRQFIVSADRLFGLYFWSMKTVPDIPPTNPMGAQSVRDSGTEIDFLFGSDAAPVGGNGAPIATVPVYSAPQLGLDYVFGPGITVGGSVGYLHRGSSREQTAVNNVVTSRDMPSGHAFLFHPRGGYVFDFTPLLSVWARGGITYFFASSEGTNATGTTTTRVSVNGFALTLDPSLVITPLPHLGVTVGPMLDLPLGGGATTETTNGAVTVSTGASFKVTNFGLSAGALAYF